MTSLSAMVGSPVSPSAPTASAPPRPAGITPCGSGTPGPEHQTRSSRRVPRRDDGPHRPISRWTENVDARGLYHEAEALVDVPLNGMAFSGTVDYPNRCAQETQGDTGYY